MEDVGIEFLNLLYKDLYKSPQVMGKTDDKFISKKIKNIRKYIDRLEHLHNKVSESEKANALELLKHFYYEKYVIKKEDIPKQYLHMTDTIIHNQKNHWICG